MKMRKGFTLVELLIVIVIIGILAAAMLLSSGSATASATASNIVSNLRNAKAAVIMWYSDNMDTVATDGPAAGAWDGDKVRTNLGKYIDNPQNLGGMQLNVATDGMIKDRWMIGLEVLDAQVQEKLKGKAKTSGLFGSAALATVPGSNDVYTNQKAVWMIAR